MTTLEVFATDVHLSVDAKFDTIEEAREFAGLFPKSAKFSACRLGVPKDGDYRNGRVEKGMVRSSAKLAADGVNGGANETAAKRYRTIMRTAAKLGIEIDWRTPYGNSIATREEFERMIGVES